MSVTTKLARQAVKTTAKHTAHTAASKISRRPFRTVTLLALGAVLGGIVGFLLGRSGGGEGYPEPPAEASVPTGDHDAADTGNSAEPTTETGAVPWPRRP
ncbi:MAG: hypothetical protein JST08_19320 [Actinobacteria bacterium]|nr:hypothetical protein [Actinomycetota bacterium]